MSGIAGMLHLDGSPADETTLVKINDAARHRGPERGHAIVIGSGGLAYRHFETGNDHGCPQQPLEYGELKIVLDGRIDNRTSVQSALASTGRVRPKCSDAELIAIAYEYWGTDCVDRFVGEFAFVLWDGRQRSLFCARDALGVKPLHYYVDSRLFVCASEIQQLLLHPRVQAQPNEGMLGEYLCRQVKSRTETLYRNIFRLPGGHWLLLGNSGLKVSRYWNFRGTDDGRRTDQEYAEEFLSLFSESIRCRTDDRCRIGLDLSGGLDSSSIVGTASRLAGSRNRFEAFSLGCPEPRADERVFIKAVSDQTAIQTHMFEASRVNAVRIQEIVTKYRDLPGPANLLMHDSILDSFQRNDVRIRLTGSGGDQLTIGDPKHIADMLRRFRLVAAYQQVHLDVRVLGDWGEKVSAFHVFKKYGVSPLLPPSARWLAKRVLRRPVLPFWMEPKFARKINLADRLAAGRNGQRSNSIFPTIVQNDIWNIENDGWWGLHLEWWDRYNFSFGVEVRHPFYDRRLVEFCLSLPEEQRWRGDETRFLLRSAMKGILPEIVRVRRSKGDFTGELIRHLFEPEVRETLERSFLAAQGYISQAAVFRMYEQFRSDCDQGVSFPRFEPQLTMFYGLESWLRSLFP